MDDLSIHTMRYFAGLPPLPEAPPLLRPEDVPDPVRYSTPDELAMEARIIGTELLFLVEQAGFDVPEGLTYRGLMEAVRTELIAPKKLDEATLVSLDRLVGRLERVEGSVGRLEEEDLITAMGEVVEEHGYEIPVEWTHADILEAIVGGLTAAGEEALSEEAKESLCQLLEAVLEEAKKSGGAAMGAGNLAGRVLRGVGRGVKNFVKGVVKGVSGGPAKKRLTKNQAKRKRQLRTKRAMAHLDREASRAEKKARKALDKHSQMKKYRQGGSDDDDRDRDRDSRRDDPRPAPHYGGGYHPRYAYGH
jgi:hypothetical protein